MDKEKLGIYIIELLRVHNGVPVRGIGVFKKLRTPAKFDESTNSFIAPNQAIVLIDEDISDHSILINIIQKEEGSSKTESEINLQQCVNDIQRELEEEGKSMIPNLGELIKEGDGYVFLSETEKSSPLYKDVKEFKLIGKSNKAELSTDKINHTEIAYESETEKSSTKWLLPILLIAGIAIVGSIWFLKPFDRIQQKEIITNDKNLAPLPSTEGILDSIPAPIDTTSSSLTENIPSSTGPTYEIIIVSFGKLSEAENYVANMNAKGYKIRILENRKPGNLYKISYASYSTEEEANKALQQVKKALVKDAWILKSNN